MFNWKGFLIIYFATVKFFSLSSVSFFSFSKFIFSKICDSCVLHCVSLCGIFLH